MVQLSEDNHKMFLLPQGFAHGFIALSDIVDFEYMVGGNQYNKDSERAIIWNDPDLDIPWGTNSPIVSEKDSKAPRFKDVDSSDLF